MLSSAFWARDGSLCFVSVSPHETPQIRCSGVDRGSGQVGPGQDSYSDHTAHTVLPCHSTSRPPVEN